PPTASKFIDGLKVSDQPLPEGLDGRWSLAPADADQPWALLFSDDNGETESGYLASLQFRDYKMTDAEIAGLGGTTAGGIFLFDSYLEEPRLAVRVEGARTIISWIGEGFLLEESDGVGSDASWRESEFPPQTEIIRGEVRNQFIIPAPSPATRFFR